MYSTLYVLLYINTYFTTFYAIKYVYCCNTTLFYVRVFLILHIYDYGYDAYDCVHYGSNILI